VTTRPSSPRTGRCPHCGVHVRFDFLTIFSSGAGSQEFVVAQAPTGERNCLVSLTAYICPACNEPNIVLNEYTQKEAAHPAARGDLVKVNEYNLWPPSTMRGPIPESVPSHIRSDYQEAARVLALSPKASAALSRRCLQAVLTEVGKAKSTNLADQIDEVKARVPSYIADSLDDVRRIGNFAAHPKKNTATGEVINVEPGEAEFNLDVLDMLFDHFYVQPARAAKIKAAVDQKQASARSK